MEQKEHALLRKLRPLHAVAVQCRRTPKFQMDIPRPSIRRRKKSAPLIGQLRRLGAPFFIFLSHLRIPTAQYDGLWHGGTWLIQVQLITVVCLVAWAAVSSYVILWVSTG